MSEIYVVDIDHDFKNNVVIVEYSDGTIKNFKMKPILRHEAEKIIDDVVRERLKLDTAFDNLGFLCAMADHDNKHDYEITDDLNEITLDYGYFVADKNGNIAV